MDLFTGMRTDTEDLVVVREQRDEDNDPTGVTEHVLPGCRVVARQPAPDTSTTGERVLRILDVRSPDRGIDLTAIDRIRRPGEPAAPRARWRVEGEPARSPFPDGGCVFVLAQQAG